MAVNIVKQIVRDYTFKDLKSYQNDYNPRDYNDPCDYRSCFHCGSEFKLGDKLHIITVEESDKQRKFLCVTCAGLFKREMEIAEQAQEQLKPA